MNSYELAADSIANGTKIRKKSWDRGHYIYRSGLQWLDENEMLAINIDFDIIDGWEKFKEPVKIITWYLPRIVWWSDQDYPQYFQEEVSENLLFFQPSKYLDFWGITESCKVLEWHEIQAPETREGL